MYSEIATNDPSAVEVETQRSYLALFPKGDLLFVPRIFGWARECFEGRFAGYQAVDTRYHDFEHTLQGTLCLVRLLRARHLTGAQPILGQNTFQLALLAILFHDTGYLKRQDDVEGTGAKYTVTHVTRSAEFAARLLGEKGFSPSDILAVQNMIRCTGVNTNPTTLPFQSEAERIAGYALATSDLLGQMAADNYVDKLPILFEEFAEAARHTQDKSQFVASFKSASDLMSRTPVFWEKFVLPKLEREFIGLYRFLNFPYPDGPNYYLDRISRNLVRLNQGRDSAGANSPKLEKGLARTD